MTILIEVEKGSKPNVQATDIYYTYTLPIEICI